MPSRRLWAFERGAFWAMDLGGSAPAPAPARPQVAATFSEVAPAEAELLAGAMEFAGTYEVQRRFIAGSRCFVARIGGEIAGYGWVSQGEERIGELERIVRLRPDDAYVWDCATLSPFRCQGVYSALLGHIAMILRREGFRRLWIGASLGNHPSLKGFANAGFQPVVTILYARLLCVSRSWLIGAASAPPELVASARRALVDNRGGERESLYNG